MVVVDVELVVVVDAGVVEHDQADELGSHEHPTTLPSSRVKLNGVVLGGPAGPAAPCTPAGPGVPAGPAGPVGPAGP